MSIITLNARGLKNIVKRKALFLFAKQHKNDFCYFQESHSAVDDTSFWRTQWGNDLWLAHGSERSAGAANLKNKFSGNILHTDCDPSGHYICQILGIDQITVITVNIYGFQSKTQNDNLLEMLENRIQHWLDKFPNAFIVIGGDFNMILDSTVDCWPPRKHTTIVENLKMFIEKFNLIDVWRMKFPGVKAYTWRNKSSSRQSRLDYWLVSKNLNIDNVLILLLHL